MFEKIAEALGFNQNILICCYGKLPVYKDFIFIGTDAREIYHFKEWIDKGFGTGWNVHCQWNECMPLAVSKPHRILMAFPQQRNVVVASIWDSSDTGGLRRFPFAFFVVLPRGVLKDSANTINILLPIWEILEEHYLSTKEIKDISEFYKKYRGLGLNIKEMEKNIDISEQLEHTSVKSLVNGLFKENGEQCWLNLLQDVSATLSFPHLAKSREPDIALRLPLAGSMDVPMQVEMWMRLVRTNFPRPLPIPTIFFPCQSDEDCPAAFSILWRTPKQGDVQLLSENIQEYQHITDLTGVAIENSGSLDALKVVETMADLAECRLAEIIGKKLLVQIGE